MTRFDRTCMTDGTSDDTVFDTVDRRNTLGRHGLNRPRLTWPRLTWMWLFALSWALPAACVSAACRPVLSTQISLPAYESCALSQVPAVFAEPELAALYAGLAPGQSLEVTQAFLRVAAPWPYLDIRGPGASSGGGMPNEPRAVFLLRAQHPAVTGPLLIVAPARLHHQLRATAGGGLPQDSWRIADGPFAPTFYGHVQRNRAQVGFVAYPRTDPAASGPVNADQRAAQLDQIVDFLVSE